MITNPKTYSEHFKAVLKLGLPLVGGHLAQMAIGFTDTIMIGWYGVPELAALTLATSFNHVLFLFGCGFAFAIMPMVATFASRGDETQIRRATRMGLWLSGFYFLLVLPVYLFSKPLLLGMGQTDQTASLAQSYLQIAVWGLLPGLAVMVLKNYLAGLEYTRVVLWITIAAVFANMAANYGLIFGNFGLPEMGIAGAAIASVIVQLLSVVLVVIYALRVLPQHQLFVRFFKADTEMLRRVFSMGLPIGFTMLAEVGLFAAASVLMGWIGTIPLAAHGVAIMLASATFIVQLGISNAATVRAGNALGRNDVLHLNRGAHVVIALAMFWVAVSIAAFVIIPNPLMSIFLDPNDPEREAILAVGRGLLVMAALFQLVDALQVIHLGLLRGLHDTQAPMVITALAYWVIGMPAAYFFGFVLHWEGQGIWLGLTLGLTTAAVLMMRRFWARGAQMVASQG
jgi:MATE family multidrug resistance protein